MTNNKKNLYTYAIFILIATLGMIYGQSIQFKYPGLRVWSVENILCLGLGIPFLLIQSKASLPHLFDTTISNKQRFLHPILIGAVFGILDILVIKIILHPEPYTSLPPFLQPFPYSLFLFFSGALEIEVFYRLIPLSLLLLIGKKLRGGAYFHYFLWAALVLTSIREPLEQFPTGELWYISYALFSGFFMNFLQAIYFKKVGFLASLTIRLGHYLFWHIILGIYVQYIELT